MNKHQQLAIRALENMRGDDRDRTRSAFRVFTPEQMKRPYGISGMTRAEILANVEARHDEITAAIEWVKAQVTP